MHTAQMAARTGFMARRKILIVALLGATLSWLLAAPGAAMGRDNEAPSLAGAPALAYSSYLGGNSDEEVRGMVRDNAGNLYLVGNTYSTDFAGSPNLIAGSDDVFVAKFDPSGKQLLYRTIIGGKSTDAAIGIAVNSAGEVAVTVTTYSLDFPLLNPLLDNKPDYNGAIFKLDPAGKLAFSSFLNVSFSQNTQNIAFDSAGNMVFTGTHWAGATEGRENIGIYILKGDGSAAVQLGQFGGDWIDSGYALAIGPDGKIYIAGLTHFRDGGFPLSNNAFQQECGAKSYGASDPYCDDDAFVAVLNATGSEVLYATYLGGDGSETVYGIGVDDASNVYVVGTTSAQNFPVKNAFQANWLGADNFSNGFVTKFNPELSAQLYSTFFSSQDQYGSEYIHDVVVDGAGNLAITGLTNGQYFPVKDPIQNELDGRICVGSTERYCNDAFVSSFDPNGALTFSTYLGGNDDDSGYAIVGDGAGGFWVAGRTEASDFATTSDARQPNAMMQSDAFVTHIGSASNPPPTETLNFKVYLPIARN